VYPPLRSLSDLGGSEDNRTGQPIKEKRLHKSLDTASILDGAKADLALA
jgi:hypothetical protein